MKKIKKDFLEKLKSITPEEINRIILEKGKEPKPISPIRFIDDY